MTFLWLLFIWLSAAHNLSQCDDCISFHLFLLFFFFLSFSAIKCAVYTTEWKTVSFVFSFEWMHFCSHGFRFRLQMQCQLLVSSIACSRYIHVYTMPTMYLYVQICMCGQEMCVSEQTKERKRSFNKRNSCTGCIPYNKIELIIKRRTPVTWHQS